VSERVISDYCSICPGRCCTHLDFKVRVSARNRELLAAHYGTEIQELSFKVHHRCPHLLDDGRCDLWRADPAEDKRPAVCQNTLCGRAKQRRIVFEVEG